MEISQIVKNVLFRYPLFGNTIENINIKLSKEPILSPSFTDGKTIYYKEELFKNYTEEEMEFIISHEIFHIALSHIFRNTDKDQDLLNYVEDAIINQLLIRDGLTMPKNLIYIPDALDYSVEELYMKLLPQINEIKKIMKNYYHISLNGLSEGFNNNEKIDIDFQDILDLNNHYKKELFDKFQSSLIEKANNKGIWGNDTNSEEHQESTVGNSKSIVNWIEILKSSISTSLEPRSSFCEVQLDGIIKKEEMHSNDYMLSEIIIDSSASVDMDEIRVVLRECKNILPLGCIKIGFADTKFYGFTEIIDEKDIDDLKVIGRGGTNFQIMAESFSSDSDNKIVITDGICKFPPNHPEILWLVLSDIMPDKGLIEDPINTKIILVDTSTFDYEAERKYILKRRN